MRGGLKRVGFLTQLGREDEGQTSEQNRQTHSEDQLGQKVIGIQGKGLRFRITLCICFELERSDLMESYQQNMTEKQQGDDGGQNSDVEDEESSQCIVTDGFSASQQSSQLISNQG